MESRDWEHGSRITVKVPSAARRCPEPPSLELQTSCDDHLLSFLSSFSLQHVHGVASLPSHNLRSGLKKSAQPPAASRIVTKNWL
ncbi:hypothetical protein AcV5_010369 [Taiwanofungus camphoratus]|nr:hypothetical protein AcV5_010369 [Antrodia cinnamomea]